ncbi:MAG TPA: protoglobin domain-containing protein [Pirellulaceae bacterium]|nr:protoglobin domain-containing protein [Pirellulaceae bacterium]
MASESPSPFERYQELQRYVSWTPEDADRVWAIGPLVAPHFAALVDDFYAEIKRHPDALKVITGGEEQIARLKKMLVRWLEELVSGTYDRDYVERRWAVGFRHVEIGLNQVYTNAALSRLRRGLLLALQSGWAGSVQDLMSSRGSLNTLLDLDLAIIEDAYQTEFQRRQAEAERRAATILARQRAEGEIARLHREVALGQERYQALFESTLDGLLILDNERQIVDCNPAAGANLGYEPAMLRGIKLEALVAADEGREKDLWPSFFGVGKQVGECRLLRREGTSIDAEYRAVENMAPGLHLLSIHDITARKRAEARMRQSERLAAVGETMAGLVHESRNALQRSKACLEMLALEVEDRPEALSLVARAQRAQDDLHRLYEEVRQWAAPLNLSRQRCDLKELWTEVWTYVRQARPERAARLSEQVTCDTSCEVDGFAMSQVFRNIFENAVEASPEQGEVTIRCSDARSNNGNEICITITDQGRGLTAEQQARIFEPFFTTKAKGTGLGMAIVQRIVHSHGGTISARSSGGAQIEITLPRGAP